MSDRDMVVKIKTHGEGKVETIENSLTKLAVDNRDFFTNLNAIILYAGASNISDTDTPDSVVNGLRYAAERVHNVNPEAGIVISSILPRRNNRHTDRIISETNEPIAKSGMMCSLTMIKRFLKMGIKSKKISNNQELIQSDPISCPQNQKGNN